ncbi:MAG: 3-hydroxyacyl-CoA dehydrogenase/enoyl-CoA hydratase/3-hydroxybutyryl-CoA epimerase [Phenylobacterium sp.]|jgi:3-hydroxyacyl-CoA dehydrogenase/enoyl-CoA hydratase/3-hydroxybutyryl-CoA epimerase
MNSIDYQIDQHNIAHIIFDQPNSAVNLMDLGFADDLTKAVDQVLSSDCIGVIMRSAKSTFFAGGDLAFLAQTTDENAHRIYQMSMQMKTAMRALETCSKPVVAGINGAALGGGFELALSCHYRIALDEPGLKEKVKLGLPEVSLGLLPGAGGITRMVRLLGLQGAMPYLTLGKLFNPNHGLKLGLIDLLVNSEEQLLDAARCWIVENPRPGQPYDVKGYQIPGGTPSDPAIAQALAVAPVVIRNATKGTLPAPEAILSCMVEGAQVDFAGAQRIESRYFTELARGQISKNLINTLWFNHNEIKSGHNRPNQAELAEKTHFSTIGVIGAGMMGAGIAYVCASAGINVVLKDITLEAAEIGKNYSRQRLQKLTEKGRLPQNLAGSILARITPSVDVNDLAESELVIEAVFEDRQLKAQVTQEVEMVLDASAVFASNTSTLPISGLAEASDQPKNFIGIHFFSPVDKMPLVEIICGEQTSNVTLAKAYDLAQQLGKTPIVVNDSRGFYTSRVFTTYVKEGIGLLAEVVAATIENAAYSCGFGVGPLAVTDEISLSLLDTIGKQTIIDGQSMGDHPADVIIQSMLDQQRVGKAAGAGFYDYGAHPSQSASPSPAKKLWPELAQYCHADTPIAYADVKDRLLFIMALETARCYEQGVLRSVGDANIGSIFGIGYPQWTGGTLQFINQTGLGEFVRRANELADAYGERFRPSARLQQMAQDGEVFT